MKNIYCHQIRVNPKNDFELIEENPGRGVSYNNKLPEDFERELKMDVSTKEFEYMRHLPEAGFVCINIGTKTPKKDKAAMEMIVGTPLTEIVCVFETIQAAGQINLGIGGSNSRAVIDDIRIREIGPVNDYLVTVFTYKSYEEVKLEMLMKLSDYCMDELKELQKRHARMKELFAKQSGATFYKLD